MSDQESLLTDVDRVLASTSAAKRLAMLRKITDLLLTSGNVYTDEQVAIFDAVMERLTKGIEGKALVELSSRLAEMEGAPAETISHLSSNDDIAVSGPVLKAAPGLKDETLVDVAKTKSQLHLLAIASRALINAVVTDVLVERGDPAVKSKMLANANAHISEMGFVRLIDEASRDKAFANVIAKRDDVPAELQPFLKLALG